MPSTNGKSVDTVGGRKKTAIGFGRIDALKDCCSPIFVIKVLIQRSIW